MTPTQPEKFCQTCGQRKVAEYFPPGEYIANELKERGISDELFAAYLGLNTDQFAALLVGQMPLLLGKASLVARFFGTPAEFWVFLERAWRKRPKDFIYEGPIE